MTSKDNNTLSAEQHSFLKSSCIALSQNSEEFWGVEVESTCLGIIVESVSTQEKALSVRGGLSCVYLGAFHIRKGTGRFLFTEYPREKYEKDLVKSNFTEGLCIKWWS